MKLLMLGASLISIANFATASSEEGIVPEEVVKEEFLPPPYRYSGDKVDCVKFPSNYRRGKRGYFHCKTCEICHDAGSKRTMDFFVTPSKSLDELANPYFFNPFELKQLIFNARTILPLARENKSSDIVVEAELPEEKRKAFYKRLADCSYLYPESGPTYSEDIENCAITYLEKRYQECHLKQIDFACSASSLKYSKV